MVFQLSRTCVAALRKQRRIVRRAGASVSVVILLSCPLGWASAAASKDVWSSRTPVVGNGVDPKGPTTRQSLPGDPSAGPRQSDQRLAASSPFALEHHLATFGTGIGRNGMVVADLDGDQDLELIATGWQPSQSSHNYWFVFDHDGDDYSMIEASLPSDETIVGLTAVQLDAEDSPLEIVVVLRTRLLVLDGDSLELRYQFEIVRTSARGFEIANVDADPSLEVFLCDHNGTEVYDLDSGTHQLSMRHHECRDMGIGEVDGTPGLELVIANGDRDGFVLDAASGDVEWYKPDGFGLAVEVGDLDGDGLDEIVASFEYETTKAWNGDSHDLLWDSDWSTSDRGFLQVGDLEGDGSLEVFVGGSGVPHALDGASGERMWFANAGDARDTQSIAIGDLDEDGNREVIFGSGFSGSRQDNLFVVDAITGEQVWMSEDYGGPFLGLSKGDVDGDGVNEVVTTCYKRNNGRDGGKYFVHDAETKRLEHVGPERYFEGLSGVWEVETADIDDDPQLEILMPFVDDRVGVLACWDGLDHSTQWEFSLGYGFAMGSVEVADLGGDIGLGVVVGELTEFTGNGTRVYVLNPGDGTIEWESPDLVPYLGKGYSELTLLRVSDIDGDGVSEVVVADHEHELMILDPVADTVELVTDGLDVTALDTADLDSSGPDEIVIGTENGYLATVNAETGEVVRFSPSYGGAINGLEVVDLDRNGVLDYVFAATGRVHVVLGDTMSTWWVSPYLGRDTSGAHDSLIVGDPDQDGRFEIWVNTGQSGIAVFEVSPPE